MEREAWLARNRAAVLERLRWLHDQPDGTLFFEPAGSYFVVVNKAHSHIRLALVEQVNPSSNLTQSKLHLNDPLYLASAYSQAAMLGLVWQSQPCRIYVIGFGGGRIPLVLHHYLHEAVIECTEIEPAVVDVAIKFFGVQLDDRLTVTVQDGREYLAGCGPGVQYDMIVVDVLLGNGHMPYHLATREFYDLCQAHLSAGGVVVVNLLDEDAFHADKVKTIRSAFEQTYLCPVPGGNTVVFATQGVSLDEAELIERAKSLQNYHRFSFPLVKRALELRMCSVSECGPPLDRAQVLRDDSPPDGYGDHLPSFDGG